MKHIIGWISRLFSSDHETNGAVDPRFQVSMLVVSNILLGLFFLYPVYRYSAYETPPRIDPITDRGSRVPIGVGLHIENFLESDIIKNNFGFEGIVWFTYPVGACTLDLLQQFTLEQGSITFKEVVHQQTRGELETVCFAVQGLFKVHLDFRGFPLDDHTLYIMLKHDSMDPAQYVWYTDHGHFTIDGDARINNCVIEHYTARAGTYTVDLVSALDTLPSYAPDMVITGHRACFQFECRRQDLRHFANVWLPLILIFFLAVFAFSFAPTQHGTDVPAIAAAGVPAILAYRFVIESMSPDVNYFMLSDYLFFLFLFLCLLVLYGISWGYNKHVRIKKLLIVGMYAIMIVGSVVLVWLMNV